MRPLRLHLLSDVHLEFGDWPKHLSMAGIDCDVHVLAGDIGVGLSGLDWALRACARPVVYVMGNHEFYGARTMDELWAQAREMVAGSHVHLLENESVEIGGVRFLGATLWTDFRLHGARHEADRMRIAESALNDYASITVYRSGARRVRLNAQGSRHLHRASRAFLERALPRAPDPSAPRRTTVVVTHHAPSALSLPCERAAGAEAAAYASALESLAARADLWVHGHAHTRADYCLGCATGPAGRVVANPRGYAGHERVEGFDPGLILEVMP